MTWYYILGAYILLANIVTYIFYYVDKRKAKKGAWRIPESTLILLAFFGGSVGALLGMQILRHKTKHVKFMVCVPLALILHVGLLLFWLYY
jgi:uncharacterized membrane protein YsdA (DUF1294 family)